MRKHRYALLATVCFVISQSAWSDEGEYKVKATLVPDKETIMLGEPSFLSYIVNNESNQDLQVVVGGDYRNALGRPDTFSVKVLGKDGKQVPQPDAGLSLGGIIGAEKIPTHGSYTFKLFLPAWATFEKTGYYSIAAQKTLRLSKFTPGKWDIKEKTIDIKSQASARVTVIPQDKKKMGELITDLGNRIYAESGVGSDSAIQLLSSIDDDRTIPYFAKALSTNNYGLRHQALSALAKFNNESAFQALKKGVMTKGEEIGNTSTLELANQLADNLRLAAANALSKSPYPEAIPFLLSRRNDSYYGVRVTILHVLGKMDPKEAIPLLKEMSHDPNKIVSDEAKRYLKLRGV